MNIDSLLDLTSGVVAYGPDGQRVKGSVSEVSEEDIFVLVPDAVLNVTIGSIVKVTDGQDSVLAKVIEKTDTALKMIMECYLSPGHERRADVRIYDRVYFSAQWLCHSGEKAHVIPQALERIQANKLIIDSFLKGKYGYPGSDDAAILKDVPMSQGLWEVNRKLDLLIHMFLADDFKDLMNTAPRDVNISASGIRFISDRPYEMGDLVEIRLILPMVPLLFIRLVGEAIRQKNVTSTPQAIRYAVAVRFLRVDAEIREDIIRYLFRRQREVLRRRQP
ncbi:MAG TPA: PilZ domain-containing protein [Desulfomonilia bacterium]|nr:PilZ domain-containing protein [Desulfomonilia bacterium]